MNEVLFELFSFVVVSLVSSSACAFLFNLLAKLARLGQSYIYLTGRCFVINPVSLVEQHSTSLTLKICREMIRTNLKAVAVFKEHLQVVRSSSVKHISALQGVRQFSSIDSHCNSMFKQYVEMKEIKRFMVSSLTKVGADVSHADALAEVLIDADYRGHYSHGLNRLDMYIRDFVTGICNVSGSPKVVKENMATALVDGNNLLGPVVGKFCIELAMQKADKCGISMVVAKNSNHYGIAGHYPLYAASKGFIPMYGTNPIAFVAPAEGSDNFALDMATTTVALGKIELAERKGEKIPSSWAADKTGKETNNPSDALSGGALLPLGGMEITGGYKGYGLGCMVEILCGILADAAWGPYIRRWKDGSKKANLGQCFIAVKLDDFAPNFRTRLQTFLNTLRAEESIDPEMPVLVAGDPERLHMKLCDDLGGIPYHPNQIQYMFDIADRFQLQKPQVQTIK
ncbi:Malate dehydrogenase [Trichinella murrelli]|uniref:Malate dehydrogenase n=1 Tax=Trichinella murrelli TaxID=144512 RepID=A0A0V0TDW7_9BILA|nr:Malate dehydrogenase [Trichinella murrelli]